MRIETVMNHNQNDGLLKMIRRTDLMISVVESCKAVEGQSWAWV